MVASNLENRLSDSRRKIEANEQSAFGFAKARENPRVALNIVRDKYKRMHERDGTDFSQDDAINGLLNAAERDIKNYGNFQGSTLFGTLTNFSKIYNEAVGETTVAELVEHFGYVLPPDAQELVNKYAETAYKEIDEQAKAIEDKKSTLGILEQQEIVTLVNLMAKCQEFRFEHTLYPVAVKNSIGGDVDNILTGYKNIERQVREAQAQGQQLIAA
jgi:hypothetical protein